MKNLGWRLLLGAMFTGSLMTTAIAQSSADKEAPSLSEVTDSVQIVDLATVTCRDLLRSEGEDRANTLAFLHGDISGKAQNPKIDGVEIAESTNRIVDTCINEPDTQLLSVFEAHR